MRSRSALRPRIALPCREIGSLSRMNDDGTNIIVSQQRRDLVFGDWASAAIFLPRQVWIGDKLLHHLLRCYFRAVLGEHRPQSRQQLYSDAWLIWSAREVNRRPTCLLGPTTTSMLRNLQQQFPIGVQPIVQIWRLRRLQVLDDTDVVGSPPCELAPIVENSGSSAYAKSSTFSSGFLGHILRIILRLAIVRGNLVLPRMPRMTMDVRAATFSQRELCQITPRLQPAFTIARRSDFRQNRSSASSMIRVGCSRSTVRYTLGPVGSTLWCSHASGGANMTARRRGSVSVTRSTEALGS